MIRKDYDISDKEFDKIIKPFDDALHNYVRSFLHDYLAFYIATAYRMDALWEGTLSGHINTALDRICEVDITQMDITKIKKILKEKHSLILTNDKNIQIQDTKKEDQR